MSGAASHLQISCSAETLVRVQCMDLQVLPIINGLKLFSVVVCEVVFTALTVLQQLNSPYFQPALSYGVI